MKFIPSNIEIMNKKYSSNKEQSIIIKDAIDDDNHDFTISRNNLEKNPPIKKEHISEIDLENEVYRLQDTLKKLNENFAFQRKQLEDDCCEQLKELNQSADQIHHLQQDLEQGKKSILP
jgi:molecular chaperone DnaK (HSP70)